MAKVLLKYGPSISVKLIREDLNDEKLSSLFQLITLIDISQISHIQMETEFIDNYIFSIETMTFLGSKHVFSISKNLFEFKKSPVSLSLFCLYFDSILEIMKILFL